MFNTIYKEIVGLKKITYPFEGTYGITRSLLTVDGRASALQVDKLNRYTLYMVGLEFSA